MGASGIFFGASPPAGGAVEGAVGAADPHVSHGAAAHELHEWLERPEKSPRHLPRIGPWPWPQVLHGVAQGVGQGAGAGQGAAHGASVLHEWQANRPENEPRSLLPKLKLWPEPQDEHAAGAGALQLLQGAAAGGFPNSALARITKAAFTRLPPNEASRDRSSLE